MKATLKLLLALIGVFAVSLTVFYAVYGALIVFNKGQVITFNFEKSSDLASWIQAIGSIGAILGAFVIGERQAAKAREYALHFYKTERKRIDAGARGVVGHLFGELLSLKDTADELPYEYFVQTWNSMLKGASHAAINAFDHLPLHELGTANRVRIGFEMRGTLVDCIFNISRTLAGENDPPSEGQTSIGNTYELRHRRTNNIRSQIAFSLKRQEELRNAFYDTYATE